MGLSRTGVLQSVAPPQLPHPSVQTHSLPTQRVLAPHWRPHSPQLSSSSYGAVHDAPHVRGGQSHTPSLQ